MQGLTEADTWQGGDGGQTEHVVIIRASKTDRQAMQI